MTIKREFPKALLKEWGLPYEGAIEDDITETSRWSEHHTIIFKAEDDGLLYEAWYSKGLTEYQDESPWEYDETVTATRVEKRKVLVYKYLPVEEAS